MYGLREDLLKLVPDYVKDMSLEEFITFVSNKFNLTKHSIKVMLDTTPKEYIYLCKLYGIRSRYIEDAIIYNEKLVTQKYLAEKFNLNELTIGRHRKRINNDVEFIKLLESGALIASELSNKCRSWVNGRYSPDFNNNYNKIYDFGFGIKCSIIEYKNIFNINVDNGLLHNAILKHGAKNVHIHYQTGVKYQNIKEHVYIVNNKPYNLKMLCEEYNKSYNYMKYKRSVMSKDDFINEYFNTNKDEKPKGNNAGISVSLNVDNDIYEFRTIARLATFINESKSIVHYYVTNNRVNDLINLFHFKERLLFKDNSPYSTWFTDDTWIYECPICKRKLLMSTEELIDYKHDDVLCKEYEVEGMVDE